jgi:hypothetical protein
MMKFARIAAVLSLFAMSVLADSEGCPPLTNNNVYMIWSSLSGSCSSQDSGAGCAAYDPIVFGFETFGVNLACSAYTVQWDFGDGTAAANAQRVVHSYAPGRYNVSVRIASSGYSVVITSSINIQAQGRRRVARKASPPPPLDESTLRSVMLEYGSVEMQPGERRRLQLVKQECCVFFTPVIAVATFSIDPTSYATIDSDGVLAVNPSAPGGITLRVYANIEKGRRIVSNDVYVDTPESNPLRGGWLQTAEIPCDGSPEIVATSPPLSLGFRGGNRFDAVWIGFEIYKDYWGLYTFDRTAKKVTLGVLSGNYVPPSMRGEGTFDIANEDGWKVLRLRNVWLGRPRGDTRAPACGLVFRGGRW